MSTQLDTPDTSWPDEQREAWQTDINLAYTTIMGLPRPPSRPSLIHQSPKGELQVVEIGEELWAGVDPSCGLVVLDDPRISARHFSITRSPEGFRLRDNGSTNGIRVKGAKITERWLVHGDVIATRYQKFIFHAGEAPAGD